ncbi:MAG: polyprenyl diphosphate synthase [Nitrospirae bacterium]|nr:polyprenyl diphosphate synthase [Nitrospirota bacterium]
MDGNGRWAEMRGLPRCEGHKRGVERVREVIETALESGIEVISLYAFSVENWARPEDEIAVIMELLKSVLTEEFISFKKEDIRFKVIGNRERLAEDVRMALDEVESATKDNRRLLLQCAISYAGRNEIVRAIRNAIKKNLTSDDITEEAVEKLLDTAGTPDPDLIIRTGGEQRLSNFLLWQSAYSELYFTNTMWPDFTKEELLEALSDFRARDRRFGRIESRTAPCI